MRRLRKLQVVELPNDGIFSMTANAERDQNDAVTFGSKCSSLERIAICEFVFVWFSSFICFNICIPQLPRVLCVRRMAGGCLTQYLLNRGRIVYRGRGWFSMIEFMEATYCYCIYKTVSTHLKQMCVVLSQYGESWIVSESSKRLGRRFNYLNRDSNFNVSMRYNIIIKIRSTL